MRKRNEESFSLCKTKGYYLIALAIITLLAQSICAQNIFKAIVKDGDTKEILVGVNAVLNKTANGASSDENGIITISNIPDGKQHITFISLGGCQIEEEK